MIASLRIKTPVIGNKIILLDQVDSTNLTLKQWALEGAEEGMVVVAKEQSAGRGRGHRVWFSPRHCGLYLSVLLRPALTAEESGVLSLMLTLAVVRAMRSAARVSATIKWPNDVMIEGRKACGILVENHLSHQMLTFAVAGIGINVNQEVADFPLALRMNSISLSMASSRQIDADEVLLALLRQINLLYPNLADLEMRQKWVRTWQRYCHHMNHPVTITRGMERTEGVFRGINNWGAALVELETSETVIFESGEFSLREK
jgi:BirA family transcriptional regulator, biotin operon repressor / biotin---[acetyl-CoA-carboxylase] ligase